MADQRLGEQIRDLYLQLNSQWRTFSTLQMERPERLGVYFLCWAGLVELDFPGTAWADDTTVEFEAVARGVWINLDRSSELLSALKRAVPAWKAKKISAQVGNVLRVRLTTFGEEQRSSVGAERTFPKENASEFWGDLFLEFLIHHPIRGTVNLRITAHRAGAPGSVQREDKVGGGIFDLMARMVEAQQKMANALERGADATAKSSSGDPTGPMADSMPVGFMVMEQIRRSYPDLTRHQVESVRKGLEAWRETHEDQVFMSEENPDTGRRRYGYPVAEVKRMVDDVRRRAKRRDPL
jgi:hypothetical protein